MSKRRYGTHRYKFTEKTHSIRGIIAIVLAVAALIALVYMIIESFHSGGSAGMFIGSTGVLALMVSILSLLLAISSVREPETFRVVPYVSLLLSMISAGLWVAIYIGGMI